MKKAASCLRHLTVATCIIVFAGVAATAQLPDTAEARHAAGLKYLQAGKLNRAVAEFRQALRLDPRHVPTLLEMADLLSSRGRVFEAYSFLQQAVGQAPDSDRLHALRGRTLFHMKKFREARQEFHKALELNPGLVEPHFALAVIEGEQGRLAEAQEHIETFIARAQGPQVQQAQEVRARISLQMKDYQTALEAYRALLRAEPEQADILMKIAQALFAAGRYAEAAEAYQAVLARDPEEKEALKGWFEASYKRGAYEQAVEAMQALVKLDRWSCGPLLELVRAYRMLNEFSQARVHAERCLKIVPGHSNAHYLLGRISFQQGELERAKKELQKALQSDPNHVEALYWLATVELKQGLAAPALANLEKAVSLHPDHAGARYALALEYARQGRREEAEKQLAEFRRIKDREKWKSRSGDDAPSLMGGPGPGGPVNVQRLDDWTNFGKYLLQEDRPRDALRILQEVREVAPDDSEILWLIAHAYTEMGKIDEALEVYAEAERRAPTGLPFLGRGQVYFRLGEVEAAMADLRRALSFELAPDRATEAHLLLASLLIRKKKYVEAERELRRALELEPENAPARTLLSWTLLKLEKPGEAAAESSRVLGEKPDNASARLSLARALIDQGKLDQASSEITQAAALAGESSQVLLTRGKLAAAQGSHALAISYFEQASHADPSDVESFFLLGQQLAAQGRQPEAATAFKKATIIDSEHAESWMGLGKIYLAGNRLEPAISCFRQAVTAVPNNPEAHYQLALALSRDQQVQAALAEARQAQLLGHGKAEGLLQSLQEKNRNSR